MRLRNVKGSRETIAANDLVIQDVAAYKGQWAKLFGNDHPVYIEVGMGKGKFIVEMARQHPENNYIGIEKYSSVLVRALEKMEDFEGNNLVFIRMDAEYICDAFEKDEVSGIYLNFSDPWPKARHGKRRLTSREFLARYDQILKKDGTLEFKTDNRPLFDFSLEEVQEAGWKLLAHSFDLHHDEEMVKGNVMTEYEEKFSKAGNPICKMVISR